MIITDLTTAIDVGVKEYDVSYSSGIQWIKAGTIWKSIDRGISTAHYSSNIVIKGSYVHLARDIILGSARQSLPFQITCDNHETIFGPEFDYSDPIWVNMTAEENGYETGNLNLDVPTEYSVTISPSLVNRSGTSVSALHTRFLYDYAALDISKLHVQAVHGRKKGYPLSFYEMEKGFSVVGFLQKFPESRIDYIGTKEDVAKAKIFFTVNRANRFQLVNALVNPFYSGSFSYVYCVDMVDGGPEDRAGINHLLTVGYRVES